ncbi:hypothetical protein ACI6Q2_12975 [Chitinophagaceae bacterium LWZ2-11]
MRKYLFIVSLAFTFAACGPSTRIEQSWRDPNTVVNTAEIHKFVVAALLKNESVRRNTEDQMTALYPGKAVQSYMIFGTKELEQGKEDYYAKKLTADGYDGVVLLSLIRVEKEQRYVPGSYPSYYGTWWGYYGHAWGTYYDPGYYTTDKTYYVEVTVYSLKDNSNKLIWSGITSTINPDNSNDPNKMFESVIKVVDKRMRKEGFLK